MTRGVLGERGELVAVTSFPGMFGCWRAIVVAPLEACSLVRVSAGAVSLRVRVVPAVVVGVAGGVVPPRVGVFVEFVGATLQMALVLSPAV